MKRVCYAGLISRGIARNPSPRLLDEFLGHHYPDDEAIQVIDQGRAGAVIKWGGEAGGLMRTLCDVGIRHHERALLFTPEAYWGSWSRIAYHLGLSVHTAQDYLDKACEKVGVRGRKALVAKLFHDGFAPELCA